MKTLTPLKRPSNLRESVLERLRTAIITGELAVGDVHSAPNLGTSLGVSATPVREAMMELAREGLVETIKNKGFRVRAVSFEELDEIAEIRLLLEPPMMHRVVDRISHATFDELDELARAVDDAERHSDLGAYLAADREFHRVILACAGNEQLTELATSLRCRTHLHGLRMLAEAGKLRQVSSEHHELIQLLREGDGAGAEALLRRHISHAADTWSRQPAS